MTDLAKAAPRDPDPLRQALLDSRERWRDLVAIAADLAFETDAAGQFIFVSPETVMGWRVVDLLGRPSELLLAEGADAGFNPFRAPNRQRNRAVALKRQDGSVTWMSVSTAHLCDGAGTMLGTRGIGRAIAEPTRAEVTMALMQRQADLLGRIVDHMRTEIMAPRMMAWLLQALVDALGAHGAMILDGRSGSKTNGGVLLHEVGGDVPALRPLAAARLAAGADSPMTLRAPDGHAGMLCATPIRFDGNPGVLVWRSPGHRDWSGDDLALLAAAVGMLRVLLEHGAIQREMALQAQTDLLTGLPNRRAFTEELDRHLDRLEREGLPGAMMVIDIDRFRTLNDGHGTEAADARLCAVTAMLHTATRPGDVLARLGGDRFAVWFDGMDGLAAAERADQVCRQAAQALGGPADQPASLSIGIASRWPGSDLDGPDLLGRAGRAMQLVKTAGGGNWRVWRDEDEAKP